MNKKRVVLAGGSGFIGRALARELIQRDYEVIILTRSLRERDEDDGFKEAEWDGEHVGEWIQYLDGAEAVVNLTGRNINCRHTPENLREITESRVNSVGAIAGGDLSRDPSAAAVGAGGRRGFYGNRHDEWCDEKAANGEGAAGGDLPALGEGFYSVTAPQNAPDSVPHRNRVGARWGCAAFVGPLHQMVPRRRSRQWQAIHQLDPSRRHEPDVLSGH